MQIVGIKTSIHRVAFTETLRASYGQRTHATFLIVEVETDEGIVGYGEHDGLFFETAETFIHAELEPLLVGQDPLRIEYLNHKMAHFLTWDSFSAYPIAAIDMALYDIKGKAYSMPAYELLGGQYRPGVEITGLVHLHSVEEDVASAVRLIERGHRVLKLKVGLDINHDVERLAAIRAAVGPDVPFRIDPNMAWSPSTAIRFIRRLEPFGLQWVEQPVPAHDIEGLVKVSRAIDTPLSADESCMTVQSARRLAESGAVEVFNVYLSEAGGITRVREIAAIADAAGITCVFGTWGDGGISRAAMIHTAVSSRVFAHPSDSVADLIADDIITTELRPDREGVIGIPDGPGLGVTLDRAKLAAGGSDGRDQVFAALGDAFIPPVGVVTFGGA
jgi:L-alanine-DL-glutamate epimerase-like enolase superfamily enzyme